MSFIAENEERPKLADLLIFATGANSIPPFGFDPQPQLLMKHPDADDIKAGFPFANTCALELQIPVLNDYDVFRDRMSAALINCVTFSTQ